MRLPNLRPNTLVGACDDRESQGVSCCGLCRLDTCVSVIGVFGGLPVEARARGPFATFGFLLVGDWCTFEFARSPEWKKCWDLLRGTFVRKLCLVFGAGDKKLPRERYVALTAPVHLAQSLDDTLQLIRVLRVLKLAGQI